jgi:hypothetical protein
VPQSRALIKSLITNMMNYDTGTNKIAECGMGSMTEVDILAAFTTLPASCTPYDGALLRGTNELESLGPGAHLERLLGY